MAFEVKSIYTGHQVCMAGPRSILSRVLSSTGRSHDENGVLGPRAALLRRPRRPVSGTGRDTRAGGFEIAPGLTAYDAVFAEGQEVPTAYRLRLDPGVTYRFEAAPSLGLVYVQSGAAAFRVTTPTTVTRSGAAGENVAADTEFMVAAGDSFVLAPFTTGEVRNEGQEPLDLSIAGILPDGAGMATPVAGTPAA